MSKKTPVQKTEPKTEPRARKARSATPKVKEEVKKLARNHTELALDTLAEVAMAGSDEKMRLAAAEAILDRGWGKPSPARAAREEGDEPTGQQPIVVHVETGIRRSKKKLTHPSDKVE
ncbi:MAG: hypothetical protein QM523_11455 [Candidatus Pacebacteria bacterium]|nr:hypothetical protein [Candidatus Paceibacterota bacterium]